MSPGLPPVASVTNLVLPNPTSTARTIKSMRDLRIRVAMRPASTRRCGPSTQNTSQQRRLSGSAATGVRLHRRRFALEQEPHTRALRRGLHVESRLHSNAARQPRARRRTRIGKAGPFDEQNRHTATRGSRFACQPRMQPRSEPSLQNKSCSSTLLNPVNRHAQRHVFDGACGRARLTRHSARCPLRTPEGSPGPLPCWGSKGVAVVTCPSSPRPRAGAAFAP